MITKPCAGSSQPSAATAVGDLMQQANSAGDELSANCTSLFIYDHVDRQHTSAVDSGYYDCISDDITKSTELLYPLSQHSSQLVHAPQQQQCAGDADEDAVKLQLLAGCGSKAALEYPWMREKKCASDAMCMSASLSDRRLKQCLTSDPLTQNTGLSIRV